MILSRVPTKTMALTCLVAVLLVFGYGVHQQRAKHIHHDQWLKNVSRIMFGYLIKNEVLALSAVESQSLVKEKVGVDLYDRLEALLLKQLSSSDASLQNKTGALTVLGYPLFSIDAIEPVKEFAFHQQKTTQLAAIVSLTHLEVSGAGTILNNMLLSGTLSDFWASRAVEALYYSRERDLGNVAFTLLDKKPGGMTFRSLIPILKKRSDWPQLLPTLFNSDMYHVEQKDPLDPCQECIHEQAYSSPTAYSKATGHL